MAKEELLKWINDCDAVNIVLKMLDLEQCISCNQNKGTEICVRCGGCFCEHSKCPKHKNLKKSAPKLIDSCISCNESVCWRCYDRCEECCKVRCDPRDKLCNAHNLILTECGSCGDTLCKTCIGECRFCNLQYCKLCLFDDYQSCSTCAWQRVFTCNTSKYGI